MALDLQKYLQFSPFFTEAEKMPDLIWEKFNKKIDELPVSLSDLLVDTSTSTFVQSLTQKYVQLSVQGPDLARIIRDVVLADIFIGDMPQEISKRLGMDQATAREVANVIVSQLFAPVLEELKQLHKTKFPGRLADKPIFPVMPNTPPSFQRPTSNIPSPATRHHQGDELPESGGNIIDLRNK